MDLYLRKNLKQSAENYLIISNNYFKPGISPGFFIFINQYIFTENNGFIDKKQVN